MKERREKSKATLSQQEKELGPIHLLFPTFGLKTRSGLVIFDLRIVLYFLFNDFYVLVDNYILAISDWYHPYPPKLVGGS